jgi:hypothetical protein
MSLYYTDMILFKCLLSSGYTKVIQSWTMGGVGNVVYACEVRNSGTILAGKFPAKKKCSICK